MTRKLALVGALALAAARLTAQTIQIVPPFEPGFPNTGAVGNAVVASAHGFESLFTNPAGFAKGKPSFTVVTAAPTLGLFPSPTNLQRVESAWISPASAHALLEPLFGSGSVGAGAAAGLGYTGSGLGLGIIFNGLTTGSGPESMTTHATLAFVGGMGVNIGTHFTLGGAVRPMFQVLVPMTTVEDLLVFLHAPGTGKQDVLGLYGVGFALDFGALATFGPITYGLSVTDVGATRFSYAQDSIGALASSLLNGGGLPRGVPVTSSYMVPMRATLGVAYHPQFGSSSHAFDPTFEIDYAYQFDPNNMLRSPSPLELLDGVHAGIDIGVLSFLRLRVGYECGRVSGGVGFRLPGIQIDAEAFQKVAPSGFSGPARGVSAGVSIRF